MPENRGDTSSQLVDLAELLYESVLDEGKWPKALQTVSDFLGGRGAFHIVADPTTGVITQSESVGVDPCVNEHYLQYYAAKEVRLAPALPCAVGSILTESMLIERQTLEHSEIYAELLAPYDIPHVMFVWLQKHANAFRTIVIEGSRSHGPFERDALERYSLLVPHLVRTTRLREEMVSVRNSRLAYLSAFDALPFGVVLLDASGRVIEMTTKAAASMHGTHCLSYANGHLRAVSREDDRRLQRAIHAATGRAKSKVAPGDMFTIRRGHASAALRVSVIPVTPSTHLTDAEFGGALVLIADPGQLVQPPETQLQGLLRLTPSEAMLASALFTGITLREASMSLGRSLNTCKTQLKSIYSKTGCRSHAQLTRTIMMTMLGRCMG